jgi:hypothetical protein
VIKAYCGRQLAGRAPKGECTHVSVKGRYEERLRLQIVTWSGTNKSINLKRSSIVRSGELTDNILSAWFSRAAAYIPSHIAEPINLSAYL